MLYLKNGAAPCLFDGSYCDLGQAIAEAKKHSHKSLIDTSKAKGLKIGMYLNGLVIIDIDSKNAEDQQQLNESILQDLENTGLDRICAVYETKSKGLHIVIKKQHQINQNNRVLRTNEAGDVLIEVLYRDATAYVSNHVLGLTYKGLMELEDIEDDKKNLLLQIINKYGKEPKKKIKSTNTFKSHLSPMERINNEVDILEVFNALGFNNVGYNRIISKAGDMKHYVEEGQNKAYRYSRQRGYSVCDLLYELEAITYKNGLREWLRDNLGYK